MQSIPAFVTKDKGGLNDTMHGFIADQTVVVGAWNSLVRRRFCCYRSLRFTHCAHVCFADMEVCKCIGCQQSSGKDGFEFRCKQELKLGGRDRSEVGG